MPNWNRTSEYDIDNTHRYVHSGIHLYPGPLAVRLYNITQNSVICNPQSLIIVAFHTLPRYCKYTPS